jgi:hypothetical protein
MTIQFNSIEFKMFLCKNLLNSFFWKIIFSSVEVFDESFQEKNVLMRSKNITYNDV